MVLQRAPKKHARPFPFEEEDKRHGDGGHLDHDILSEYLGEYKCQPRAFKENLNFPQFIQLKEERIPCNNIFILSAFGGSSICIARAWGMELDEFFLLHPIAKRDVVEIAAFHLEDEANIWWFFHLSHARVITYADFNQRLINKFDKKKS